MNFFFTLSHPTLFNVFDLFRHSTIFVPFASTAAVLSQCWIEIDVALKWVLQLQSNLTSDLLLHSIPLGPFPSQFVLPGEQGQWVILHLQYIGIVVLHLFCYIWTLVTSSIGTPFKLITGKSRWDSGGWVEQCWTQCTQLFLKFFQISFQIFQDVLPWPQPTTSALQSPAILLYLHYTR